MREKNFINFCTLSATHATPTYVMHVVFLCKVLTLLPQFSCFWYLWEESDRRTDCKFSLPSLSWCCFCVGSRETISRSTKRTTTQYADCTTAQVRRGKLHVHVHVKCVYHMIYNRKRVAFFSLFPRQVVVRSREFRRESRMERLRSYFYGKKPHNFFPFSFDIALSDIEVFKIGGTAIQVWPIFILTCLITSLLSYYQLLLCLSLPYPLGWRRKMEALN